MRKWLANVLSVLFTQIKFSILKVFHFNTFEFGLLPRFSPNVIVEIEKNGKCIIGSRVRAHSGCIFKARNNGNLIIGNDVFFNYNCMVVCKDKVEIMEGVEFGPGVKIFDHDHDVIVPGGIKDKKFKTSPIIIGKNAWIGANTIILRGTQIGENAVIAAGSIVKNDVPANTLFVQKKDYEIKEMLR